MFGDSQLNGMARDLVEVAGVVAVALGGSRARGTHRSDSDFDLGLYYDPHTLDLAALEHLACRWAGRQVDIAGPGGWGPWVDGGAWITVEGTAVDWILRDVERVREQCDRALRGQYGFFAQPGHPFGFLDVAYAGEVAVAVPMADPADVLAQLRDAVTPYPAPLRSTMLGGLWQVDFLLDGALKGAKRGDVAYVTLCATHAIMLVAHAWHAAAGEWAINEKGLVLNVATLDIDSHGFSEFATNALASVGRESAELAAVLLHLKNIPRPSGGIAETFA